MSASSCSLFIPQERDIKEGSAFYAVDLPEIEKLKGEEMLFSDLIESLEIIKLDGREEALVATYRPLRVNNFKAETPSGSIKI